MVGSTVTVTERDHLPSQMIPKEPDAPGLPHLLEISPYGSPETSPRFLTDIFHTGGMLFQMAFSFMHATFLVSC